MMCHAVDTAMLAGLVSGSQKQDLKTICKMVSCSVLFARTFLQITFWGGLTCNKLFQ